MKPDGVFLSNGPADPAAVTYAIEATRELDRARCRSWASAWGTSSSAWRCGGKTYRLKFGHHGCNHPVMDLADAGRSRSPRRTTTSPWTPTRSTRSKVEITHINLNDQTVEGLRHRTRAAVLRPVPPRGRARARTTPPTSSRRFRDLIRNA